MLKKVKLPDKAWQLLQLAVNDLKLVEKDKKYTIDMDSWHMPENIKGDKTCHVCLAGCVLAKTLGENPKINVHVLEDKMPKDIQQKLRAIDCFRVGDIFFGLEQFGYESINTKSAQVLMANEKDNIKPPDYSFNPQDFFYYIDNVIDSLKMCDL